MLWTVWSGSTAAHREGMVLIKGFLRFAFRAVDLGRRGGV